MEILETMVDQLAEFMEFHTEARYPDTKIDFYQKCTKEFAQEKFKEIKEVYTWLRKKSEAILYGSYAAGKEGKDSDLDVAVISSDFGKDRYKEGTMLMKLAWRIDPRLHPVPLSAVSFAEDTWIPLVHEIKTHGVEVH